MIANDQRSVAFSGNESPQILHEPIRAKVRPRESQLFDIPFNVLMPDNVGNTRRLRRMNAHVHHMAHSRCLCGIEYPLALTEHVNGIARQQKERVAPLEDIHTIPMDKTVIEIEFD